MRRQAVFPADSTMDMAIKIVPDTDTTSLANPVSQSATAVNSVVSTLSVLSSVVAGATSQVPIVSTISLSMILPSSGLPSSLPTAMPSQASIITGGQSAPLSLATIVVTSFPQTM